MREIRLTIITATLAAAFLQLAALSSGAAGSGKNHGRLCPRRQGPRMTLAAIGGGMAAHPVA